MDSAVITARQDEARGNGSKQAAGSPHMPLARRRNLPWTVIGVLLVVGSGLVFAVWADSMTGTSPVVVTSRSLRAGDVLEASDLRTHSVAGLGDAGAVPGHRIDELLGHTLLVDLPAGHLVPSAAIADDAVLEPGEALVAISVADADLPGALRPGDRVLVVPVPDGTLSTDVASIPITGAIVFGVRDGIDGNGLDTRVVSLVVSEIDAPTVAWLAGQGAARLVLVPAEGVDPSLLSVPGVAASAGTGSGAPS